MEILQGYDDEKRIIYQAHEGTGCTLCESSDSDSLTAGLDSYVITSSAC